MSKEELLNIGFIEESGRNAGVFNFYLINEDSNKVFLQVCVKNTDVYPVLITDQYDWDEMISNTTYLPMVNVVDANSLNKSIKTLSKLFLW